MVFTYQQRNALFIRIVYSLYTVFAAMRIPFFVMKVSIQKVNTQHTQNIKSEKSPEIEARTRKSSVMSSNSNSSVTYSAAYGAEGPSTVNKCMEKLFHN